MTRWERTLREDVPVATAILDNSIRSRWRTKRIGLVTFNVLLRFVVESRVLRFSVVFSVNSCCFSTVSAGSQRLTSKSSRPVYILLQIEKGGSLSIWKAKNNIRRQTIVSQKTGPTLFFRSEKEKRGEERKTLLPALHTLDQLLERLARFLFSTFFSFFFSARSSFVLHHRQLTLFPHVIKRLTRISAPYCCVVLYIRKKMKRKKTSSSWFVTGQADPRSLLETDKSMKN